MNLEGKSGQSCPHCRNPVYDEDALNCCFCGERLGQNTGFLNRLANPSPRIFLIAGIGLILAGFLIIMIF